MVQDNRGIHWFNVSAPMLKVCDRYVRLWDLFKRRSASGHWWGIGIVQIGSRHLFFIGRVQGYPAREVWALSLLFLRLI